MTNDFDAFFAQWLRTKRYTSDAHDLAQVQIYAQGILDEEGGYPSVSLFERAYLEALRDEVIKEFRDPAPVVEDVAPIDFSQMPVAEIRRRYNSDPNFRAQYDASNGRDGGQSVPLTAEAYHKLSTSETIRRYSNEPAFKAAVDSLIERGLI